MDPRRKFTLECSTGECICFICGQFIGKGSCMFTVGMRRMHPSCLKDSIKGDIGRSQTYLICVDEAFKEWMKDYNVPLEFADVAIDPYVDR